MNIYEIQPVHADNDRSPRSKFVKRIIEEAQVRNFYLIQALYAIDRKDFVPQIFSEQAYELRALALESGASISEPVTAIQMLDYLPLNGKGIYVDVGTASLWTTALLSRCCETVITVERSERLVSKAQKKLQVHGINNVKIVQGDILEIFTPLLEGRKVNGIHVGAQCRSIPQQFIDALVEGGILVLPLGEVIGDAFVTTGIKQGNILYTLKGERVNFYPIVSNQPEGFTQQEFDALDSK